MIVRMLYQIYTHMHVQQATHVCTGAITSGDHLCQLAPAVAGGGLLTQQTAVTHQQNNTNMSGLY